jgi:Cyclic nucleotide-binding domain/4Fe-4S binding domain
MHWVRWILTIAWLLVIASLFYDPWTSALTESNHPWSPLRLANVCVQVQGQCVAEQPYPLGTTVFWGAIVPAAIFILLVFGHEVWRRICPLSFLSQIPRSLGWQRQFKRENQKTGKVRYELAKVNPDSWLGKNYPYVQFGWLFAGLCGRILFFNADRLVLAGWLLLTIAAAIAVGYFYGGKSWCQYFCPMAPVQTIYSEPGGLLSSKAHMSEQSITQSMCRTVLPDGKEQSACVACQNPCIDIDSERLYWDSLKKPETTFLRYGYVGLVVGYFGYYYLYAGNWNYYFSGAWLRQTDQLASLFDPGLYLFGQAINIPKLVAVPLVLGGCTAIGYWGGLWIEKRAKSYSRRQSVTRSLAKPPETGIETVRHRIFTLCTFGIFNFFFIFGGRPLVQLMPWSVQYLYDLGLISLSTLWLYKTWRRSSDLYSRENLASRFRKQLEKLQLNVSELLGGGALSDLNTHEVYILAKVLPGFTREKRHQAYKGVVREALEEGYVNYSSSLEILQKMRQELGITDDEHRLVLDELGIEDPELLSPNRQRSLENQIRLTGYRKSLERLILLQGKQSDGRRSGVESRTEFEPLSLQDSDEIRSLRREYSITAQEEDWIFSGFSANTGSLKKAEFLLARLPELIECYRALNQPMLLEHQAVLTLLRENIQHKKELIVRSILDTLTLLQQDAAAVPLARSLQHCSPAVLVEILAQEDWSDRLPPEILHCLTQPGSTPVSCSLEFSIQEVLSHLEALLQDQNPIIQAAALYIIAQLDAERGQAIARQQHPASTHPLVGGIAERLLDLPKPSSSLTVFSDLEKLVYLFNSDFFHRMQSETLIALAHQAEVRTYSSGEVITEAGDTCRELLLLIEGDAKIHYRLADEIRVESLHPGQTLDELEVLAHSTSENTIIADSKKTRILAISVDAFDDLLDHDPDFARRVLELESRQLQRFVRSVQPVYQD